MGEWAECDRQMANFLPNHRGPLILSHVLCALIRHGAGLSSSHFKQHISNTKDYMMEDLPEKWHIKNDVKNKTKNIL